MKFEQRVGQNFDSLRLLCVSVYLDYKKNIATKRIWLWDFLSNMTAGHMLN
jgi:hypothetical protein